MPKLECNANGEYYTRWHINGAFSTIHFDDDIKQYLNRNHIKIGDELPRSWYQDTRQWQYTQGMPCKLSTFSGLVNAKCPVCRKSVFYYENEHGSKVYFDHAGDGWPKHPCMICPTSYIKKGILVPIAPPKIIQNKISTFFRTKELSFETDKFILTETQKNCHFFLHKIKDSFKTIVIITPSFTKELQIKNLILMTTQPKSKQIKPQKIKNNFSKGHTNTKSTFSPPEEYYQKINISSIRLDSNMLYIDIKDNDICKISIKFRKITLDVDSKIELFLKNGVAESLKIKNGNNIEEYKIEKFYHKNL